MTSLALTFGSGAMNQRDYELHLSNVQRCLEVLRKFRDGNECPTHLIGTIGNLIGEVKKIEEALTSPPELGRIKSILREYDEDPVIHAYLDQRNDWMEAL
jgi:hypothetical protein